MRVVAIQLPMRIEGPGVALEVCFSRCPSIAADGDIKALRKVKEISRFLTVRHTYGMVSCGSSFQQYRFVFDG